MPLDAYSCDPFLRTNATLWINNVNVQRSSLQGQSITHRWPPLKFTFCTLNLLEAEDNQAISQAVAENTGIPRERILREAQMSRDENG